VNRDNDTEKIRSCPYHKDHANRIDRNESDIQTLFKEANAMKAWVIAGMASLVVGVVTTILDKVVK
jgi:hypothetical protein